MTTATKIKPFCVTELLNFTVTEHYYRHGLTSAKYTDGVKYLAERAGAYWLIDEVCTAQHLPRVRREPFQTWKLEVHPDRSADLAMDDGNGNVIYRKRIEFTDFPADRIALWFADNVVLLPTEY